MPYFAATARAAWTVPCVVLLAAATLDAAEPSTLKFGEAFQVELVDNRMTRDDAERAFAYARDYLYGVKESYSEAHRAFEEIGRYYGSDLADDCLLWRAKSLFKPLRVCRGYLLDMLHQVATVYPDGDVYGSRQFPDALREFVRDYGHHSLLDDGATLATPVGGVFVLYELLKAHPLVGHAELSAVRSDIIEYLRSDRARFWLDDIRGGVTTTEWLVLRAPPTSDARAREAQPGDIDVFIVRTTRAGVIGDLGGFLTEEKGFGDPFFEALAERVREAGEYEGEYRWDPERSQRSYRVSRMRLPPLCSESDASELIYGDATPAVLREIVGGSTE